MIRTQIYLTAEECKVLAVWAKLEGKTKSELIRRVLDEQLRPGAPQRALMAVDNAFGAWKGRAPPDYLEKLRKRW